MIKKQLRTWNIEKVTRTLNIKKVTNKELSKQWGIPEQFLPYGAMLYVRCNTKGIVNWDTTLVYNVSELICRNNVKVW